MEEFRPNDPNALINQSMSGEGWKITPQQVNNLSIADCWEIIQTSGCSHIQEAIKGRQLSDFDEEAVREMTYFVLTSDSDFAAAPKRKIKDEK